MRVILAQKDPALALRFWVERLGFRHEAAAPTSGAGATEWLLRRGEACVRLVAEASLEKTTPLGRRLGKMAGSGVMVEIPLAAGERIEDLFVRLEQQGVDIIEPLGAWRPGERSFTVADPSGYLVRLWIAA